MSVPVMRLGFIAVAVLLLAACGKTDSKSEPLRPVLTRVLGASADNAALTYSGEVRSRYETPLGFRIPGKISARLVDTGARVNAGDVLARLDPADTVLSAAAANAQRVLAEAEVKRFRELREKNFVSQSALDAKETAYKAAQAQADLALNQHSYTVLRAEHAGVVELVAAEVGQVVAVGQPVVHIARTDTLEVVLAIPESRLAEARLLKSATIQLWADEQASYQGVLRELSPVADAATRTYAARISIVKPDDRIRLGMTARVRPQKEDSASRLSVPLSAVFQQDGKSALWIVGADQTVSLRPVVIAAWEETEAVLESGVHSGERIVVAGVHKLSAGEKIKAVEQTSALAR